MVIRSGRDTMRIMPRISLTTIALLLIATTFIIGCNDPTAKLRTQRRMERAERWLAYSSAYEAEGWTRLGKTADLLERLHRRTAERFNRLPDEIAHWQKQDEASFREKGSQYRDWITKSVNGDLNHARKSAILLTH